MAVVELFPLVPGLPLPTHATGRVRREIPAGYGVQEQCLPFVAAASLGFLVPSPINFGLCAPEHVPPGAHAFRSPLDQPTTNGRWHDPRVFYVVDRPESKFVLNAYQIGGLPAPVLEVREPGLSFFDRDDQMDMFKLHLPYIWRTPAGLDTLFLPAVNRSGPNSGLDVIAGLVETEWYANPVNLVLRKPPAGCSVHIAAGQPIAHAIFVNRDARHLEASVVAEFSKTGRRFRAELCDWYRQKRVDRSTYRRAIGAQ